MNIYAIVLLALAAYIAVVLLGIWLKLWKKLGVDLYGPIIMLRTRRGGRSIERVGSRRRFWTAYGQISIIVVVVTMALMAAFLVAEVFLYPDSAAWAEVEDSNFPQAHPIVTVAYVLVGLVIAVLVHEFAHGIMTVTGRMKLESMGVLILLVPIGAFAEPNDKDLKSAPRKARMRLYAAGPGSNMLVAFICLVVFLGLLASSVSPVHEGAIVTDVVHDSPAELFGIPTWCEITYAGGVPITNSTDIRHLSFGEPGEPVKVSYFFRKHSIELEVPGGVAITSVLDGPALNAGLKPGMIIASLNDSTVPSISEFSSIVENATHNSPVNITVMRPGYDPARGGEWFVVDERIKTINLTSKWVYYFTHYPDRNRKAFENQSFMGVTVFPFGVKAEDSDRFVNLIARPTIQTEDSTGLVQNAMRFVTLPFVGYSPLTSPATDLYQPSGPLAFLPQGLYWGLFNLFYWVFWINFMLGLANALPALPMDGGYLLRDLLGGAAEWRGERLTGLDKALGKRPVSSTTVDGLVWVTSVVMAILLTWLMIRQVFGPF